MLEVEKLVFNLTAKTAAIEYWIDGVKVSEWIYTDGLIHVDEKPGTYETPFDQALIGLGHVQKWDRSIRTFFNPPMFPQSKYDYTIKKKPNRIVVKIEINGQDVRDDFWEKGTNIITYNPRPEINWSWADYLVWRKVGNEFIQAIRDFDRIA